jgi:hypothetical protein
MKIFNACYDIPDERDYQASEILWNNNIKDFVLNDDWEIQNQYTAWYPMGCVFFSTSMHDNWLNFRDNFNERSKWWYLCDYALSKWLWDENEWAYLSSWSIIAKDLWLIDWYMTCNSYKDMIKSLWEWFCIHTWSNKINWGELRKTSDFIAKEWVWEWHAFHCIGYNFTWEIKQVKNKTIPWGVFIFKDSSNWFDKWFFYIKIEDVENILFRTKHIFTNKILIDNYKKKIMENIKLESAKRAFENWIWNWLEPNKPITREEAASMIQRALDKIKK